MSDGASSQRHRQDGTVKVTHYQVIIKEQPNNKHATTKIYDISFSRLDSENISTASFLDS